MSIRLEDITPETLAEISAQWDEDRIQNLIGKSLAQLGVELEVSRVRAQQAEARAKMRAMRLHREFDWSRDEIAATLCVTKREVNKWLS